MLSPDYINLLKRDLWQSLSDHGRESVPTWRFSTQRIGLKSLIQSASNASSSNKCTDFVALYDTRKMISKAIPTMESD